MWNFAFSQVQRGLGLGLLQLLHCFAPMAAPQLFGNQCPHDFLKWSIIVRFLSAAFGLWFFLCLFVASFCATMNFNHYFGAIACSSDSGVPWNCTWAMFSHFLNMCKFIHLVFDIVTEIQWTTHVVTWCYKFWMGCLMLKHWVFWIFHVRPSGSFYNALNFQAATGGPGDGFARTIGTDEETGGRDGVHGKSVNGHIYESLTPLLVITINHPPCLSAMHR